MEEKEKGAVASTNDAQRKVSKEIVAEGDGGVKDIKIVKLTWIHDGPGIEVEWWCDDHISGWDTCKSLEDNLDDVFGENTPLRLAGKPPPDCIKLSYADRGVVYQREWWSYDHDRMARAIRAFQQESKSITCDRGQMI